MSFQEKVLKECTKILLELENERHPTQVTDAAEFTIILQQRYNLYQQNKRAKHEAVHAMHDWVASCCITADRKSDRPFLFEKTKLSFTIMCSHCDPTQEPLINRVQFEKWATKLYPLATKQNYLRIFLALATDGNSTSSSSDAVPDTDTDSSSFGGRLRQRLNRADSSKPSSSSASSSNLKDANTYKHDKSMYGGISMHRFCSYVKELENNFHLEQNECQGIKESLEQQRECADFSSHERILYHIRGVSDMTGLPPYYGFVILTDSHLVFQGTALSTRTTCIQLHDKTLSIERTKIGGFLKRDTALRVQCEHGTFTWNVVNIKSVRRDQLFWSVWTMQQAHILTQQCAQILQQQQPQPHSYDSNSVVVAGSDRSHSKHLSDESVMKIKRRIVMDAAEDVLRQNALQNILGDKDKFDAVSFVRYATQAEQTQYVHQIAHDLQLLEKQTTASNSMISSMFKGIIGSGRSMMRKRQSDAAAGAGGAGSDSSNHSMNGVDANYIDPDHELQLQKYELLKSDFERETKLKKMTDSREDFDLRDFIKYIKILRVEFEPLIFVSRMYQCVVKWRNTGLSMMVLVVLELVAYLDWVCYLPALLLLANGVLMISLRRDWDYTLQCLESALVYAGFDPNDFEQETLAAEQYAAHKMPEKRKNSEEKASKNKWNIVHRWKTAKYNFYKNTFLVGFHQKKLADLSVFLGRIRTIYKWDQEDKSQIFCVLSVVLGIFLWIAPLKWIFGLAVFGVMFKHSPFRSEESKKIKGVVDRYIESVPPNIPEVDSDSDSDDALNDDDDDNDEDDEKEEEENVSLQLRKKKNGKVNTTAEIVAETGSREND